MGRVGRVGRVAGGRWHVSIAGWLNPFSPSPASKHTLTSLVAVLVQKLLDYCQRPAVGVHRWVHCSVKVCRSGPNGLLPLDSCTLDMFATSRWHQLAILLASPKYLFSWALELINWS